MINLLLAHIEIFVVFDSEDIQLTAYCLLRRLIPVFDDVGEMASMKCVELKTVMSSRK